MKDFYRVDVYLSGWGVWKNGKGSPVAMAWNSALAYEIARWLEGAQNAKP